MNESTGSPSSSLCLWTSSFIDRIGFLCLTKWALDCLILCCTPFCRHSIWANKGCHWPTCWLGFLCFGSEVWSLWCLSESFKWTMPLVACCHCLGCAKSNFLRVTKNIYLDYGVIRNATCYLTWAFIGVFESFVRREG